MKSKVKIYQIMSKTAGKRHSWVESNVGKIRKPNDKLVNIKVEELLQEPKQFVVINKETTISTEKVKWYQNIWNWLLDIFSQR